jgi:membrane-associated phospholipid phosphatase
MRLRPIGSAPHSPGDWRPFTQAALFVLGTILFMWVAIVAHSLAYFPGDLGISHTVQATRSAWLDATLCAVSWLGFPPQSDVLFGAIAVLLFVFRERWEAICAAVAAVGSGGLYLLVEHFVGQPRPDADLVRVVGPIQATGFPSGHLATFTAVCGLLAYFGYCRLRPSATRWLPIGLVLILLPLMGFARIYAGHHWASDVFAGCLLGALWLAVTVRLYGLGSRRLSHSGPNKAAFKKYFGGAVSVSRTSP